MWQIVTSCLPITGGMTTRCPFTCFLMGKMGESDFYGKNSVRLTFPESELWLCPQFHWSKPSLEIQYLNQNLMVVAVSPPAPLTWATHTLKRTDRLNQLHRNLQTNCLRVCGWKDFFPEILQAAANFSEPQIFDKPPRQSSGLAFAQKNGNIICN